MFSGCVGKEAWKWKCRASAVLSSPMVILGVWEGVGFEGLPGEMRIQLKDSGYPGMVQAYPRQSFPFSLPSSQYKYDSFQPLHCFLMSAGINTGGCSLSRRTGIELGKYFRSNSNDSFIS